MSALRPLAVGEIIDRSASFWRANWRPLFQLLLGFQLAQYAMAKALDLLLRQTLREALHGAAFDPVAWLKNPPQLEPRQIGILFAAALAFLGVAVALAQVTGVAASSYIYPRLTEGPPLSVGQAVGRAFKRLGALFGALSLSFGLTAVMGLLLFAPAAAMVGLAFWLEQPLLVLVGFALALLASVGLGLWFVLRFILTAQVTAAEPLSGWGIFRRTGALSSGRVGPGFTGWVKGRLTLLVSIVFGILLLVSSVSGLPSLVLHFVYGSGFDPTREVVPVWLLIPAELMQVAATALIDPLYIVFQVVFYVDMRVRREGLDLELAMRS